ncbi:magnesium/cobalt transporter CorA [bacterium]|nr:magnesium/cobalt transporter CorA [candidate division CSSED10-310 bacterium]
MSRRMKKTSHKTGLAPGTLVHVGEKKIDRPRIRIIDFDETNLVEKEPAAIEECFQYGDRPTTTWINIDGLHDIDLMKEIGSHFNIHGLVMEDILNTAQRPKIEDFTDYLFIVVKMVTLNEIQHEIQIEQLSLILSSNYVITFQERVGDFFEPVRNRIRNSTSRMRKSGTDYLTYALIDMVVDHYFTVFELISSEMEQLEQKLINDPDPDILKILYKLKREMVYLRKTVWPLREVVGSLERTESTLIRDSMHPFWRDAYDHAVQVLETTESMKDMLSGMLEMYLSSISNRMNEVMKVLTIIATIFIPLTFIAGIFGMNFEHFPELKWVWAYPAGFWIAMGTIAGFMALYFKHKKWL